MSRWTLVQHSGAPFNPGFRHAVEEAAVTTKGMEKKILAAGGLLFETYTHASTRGEAENYPPGVTGLYPQAKGGFAPILLDGRKLYIPPPEKDGGTA
jgi:hypothetical protein